ncbi:MAG: Gluconolactonase [bacterium]|nr:Gluconolactonase [bacterium]
MRCVADRVEQGSRDKLRGWFRILTLVGPLGLMGNPPGTLAQPPGQPEKLVEVETLERISTGHQFTEGPLWHPSGYLLFSDIPGSRILRWEPGKEASVFREPSRNSNGLTFDRRGSLIACEHSARRVSRTLSDGTVEVVAETFMGKRLNSPNDVVVASDGRVYFTDPPYGLSSDSERELDFQGVFCVTPDGELHLGSRAMNRPNGLALSPDETILYVADTVAMLVNAFPVSPDGTFGEPIVFSRLDGPGADGMKVDKEGNVYVTGPEGVWIWDREGNWVGLLKTPEQPANCAFGGEDGKTLFITAKTSVYQVRTKVEGIRPGGWD